MSDEGRPRDTEPIQQVTQPHRECTQRVISARLVGLPVAEQVRSDHPVPGRQVRHDLTPRLRAATHPVDEQYSRTVAAILIGDLVAVELEILQFRHGTSPPWVTGQ